VRGRHSLSGHWPGEQDSSTTSAILDWANALQNRVDYLIVKNKVAGEDFGYLFESEPGQRFLELAKPAIILR